MDAKPNGRFSFVLAAILLLLAAVGIPLQAWRVLGFPGLLLTGVAAYLIVTAIILRRSPESQDARRSRWLYLGILQIVTGVTLAYGTTQYISTHYPGDLVLPPPAYGFCCLSVPMILAGAILVLVASK